MEISVVRGVVFFGMVFVHTILVADADGRFVPTLLHPTAFSYSRSQHNKGTVSTVLTLSL